MSAKFYLRDEEQEQFNPETKKSEKKLVKDVLFFKLVKPAMPGTANVSYEFDGRATEEHKKHYPQEYKTFLKPEPEVITTTSKGIGKKLLGAMGKRGDIE